MASEYSVNIRLNTAQVRKDLKDIKTDIDKLGKINLGTNQKTQRTEAQILDSKRAQQDMMSKTRRIGDLVQKQADQGLKVGRAQEAIQKSALLNQKKDFVGSEKLLKVALNELKIQKAISKEIAQQAALKTKLSSGAARAAKAPQIIDVSTGIASSRFGSVGQAGSPRFIASRAGMMQGPADPPYAPGMFGSSPIGGSRFMFGSPAQVAFAGSGMGRSSLRGNRFQFGSPAQIEFSGRGMGRVPIGGRSDLVGSPANLLRVGRENAMPIGGFSFIPDSPKGKKFLADQQAKQQKLDELSLQRKLGQMEERSAKSRKEARLERKRSLSLGKDIVRLKTREVDLDSKALASRVGQGRGESMPLNFFGRGQNAVLMPGKKGSFSREGFGRVLRANRGPALQSAAISGAFPLLFGQGPLAAAGGAIGGGIGGGFGGQMGGFAGGLIGTAVVSGITNFANSIAELGKSIETLDGQFKFLTEKSLFSSKEAENRAKVLQTLGEREKLATLLSKELTNVLGQDGAEKLRRAGEASKELSKTFAELTVNLQLALAGPISQFLKLVNNVLDQGTAISLGQGKGTVNLGPGEEQFLKDFGDVLANMSQSQIDNILRAQIGTNVEGLKITNQRRQAIRKFDLARQTNPAGLDAFLGGGSSFAGGNTPLEVDAARFASAQKKVKAMQKQVEFAKLVTQEGVKEADIQKQVEAITENLNEKELKMLETQGLSVRALVEKNNQAKQLVENARLVEQSFKNLAQGISTDLAQGIQGLIRGTSTLNDVMRGVLDKMVNAAFNMAFFGNAGGQLTKGLGLFGNLFGGFLSTGGPAKAGRSYIVGEKGPELFTPGVSGMVSPNSSLGGSTNIVVNVDASGTNVEGDEQQGRELGRLISVAVQSELLQQKRPGGLLA